jgi:hypothetical protein
MSNKHTIDFLTDTDYECCVLIFTRDDANSWVDREYELTDEEWFATVHNFNKYFLGENEWINFGECIPSRVEEKGML